MSKKLKETSSPKSEQTSGSKKKKVNGIKKGKQFERDVANLLGHIFPEAQRMLEYQASNGIGVDIEGTDPFLFQCKNHANYCSVGTINEIRKQREDQVPVLVTKGIRMEAMAVLPFEKFVTLLEVAYGLRPRLERQVSERQARTSMPVFQAPLEVEWEKVESPFAAEQLDADSFI